MFIKDSFFDFISLEEKDRDITAWSTIYNSLFKKMKNKNESYHGTFLYVADDDGNLITGITHNPHKMLHEYLMNNSARIITKKLWPINNLDHVKHLLNKFNAIDNSYVYDDIIQYNDVVFDVTELGLNDIVEFYDSIISSSFDDEISTDKENILIADRRLLSTYHNIDYDILYDMVK